MDNKNIRFVRNELPENETLVKAYIYPALCEKDEGELVWSNLAYQIKYKSARERENTTELAAVTEEDVYGLCVLKYLDYENQHLMLSSRWLAPADGQWPTDEELADCLDRLTGFLFDRFDIRKIFGLVDEDCAYLDVIKNTGFREEGCLKENFFKNGRYIDQYIFSKHLKLA